MPEPGDAACLGGPALSSGALAVVEDEVVVWRGDGWRARRGPGARYGAGYDVRLPVTTATWFVVGSGAAVGAWGSVPGRPGAVLLGVVAFARGDAVLPGAKLTQPSATTTCAEAAPAKRTTEGAGSRLARR